MLRVVNDVVSGRRKRPIRHSYYTTAVLIGSLLTPVGALAQGQPLAPTREEVTRDDPRPAVPPSRLQVEGGIERAPCALDNPEFKDVRFTIRGVTFDGLRGVDQQALRSAYDQYVGQEHPVALLCEIRDRAATILRQAGYIAAVEVPQQEIADGNVKFNVLMARMVQVRVRGDAGRAERVIAGYLERLTEQDVFNRYEAERFLLLASDIPGYNVRLALRPAGTTPGEVIGEVTVSRLPALIDANVQNYGSTELGRWGGLLRAQLFGLTGLGDRTTIAVFTTSDFHEQQTLQLGHDFLIGSDGLAVSGMFTYAWARPEISGDDAADVDARTLFATAAISYPLIRRQARTVRAALGFDFVDQDIELDDIDLTRDRLRVGFVRLTGEASSMDFRRASAAEPLWRAFGTIELRRGFDLFGATGDCGLAGEDCAISPSRPEADGTATVLRGSAYGEFRPARRLTFSLGLLGQYATAPLLSFEEFSAGNYTAGRGYDPGVMMGDRGLGLQAEIRLGSLVPSRAEAVAVEPYVFFDHALVRNEDRFVADGSRNLSSAGGGIRANWGDRMRVDLGLAFPLKKVGLFDEKPDTRLLLNITTRLWPWSYR